MYVPVVVSIDHWTRVFNAVSIQEFLKEWMYGRNLPAAWVCISKKISERGKKIQIPFLLSISPSSSARNKGTVKLKLIANPTTAAVPLIWLLLTSRKKNCWLHVLASVHHIRARHSRSNSCATFYICNPSLIAWSLKQAAYNVRTDDDDIS